MGILLLILLLLAAATGVLGAVLKATLVIVLSLIFTIVVLAYVGMWYARRRMRAFQREFDARLDRDHRRRAAYDISNDPRPDAPSLGDGR